MPRRAPLDLRPAPRPRQSPCVLHKRAAITEPPVRLDHRRARSASRSAGFFGQYFVTENLGIRDRLQARKQRLQNLFALVMISHLLSASSVQGAALYRFVFGIRYRHRSVFKRGLRQYNANMTTVVTPVPVLMARLLATRARPLLVTLKLSTTRRPNLRPLRRNIPEWGFRSFKIGRTDFSSPRAVCHILRGDCQISGVFCTNGHPVAKAPTMCALL